MPDWATVQEGSNQRHWQSQKMLIGRFVVRQLVEQGLSGYVFLRAIVALKKHRALAQKKIFWYRAVSAIFLEQTDPCWHQRQV
jgi:PII-like signaling protein